MIGILFFCKFIIVIHLSFSYTFYINQPTSSSLCKALKTTKTSIPSHKRVSTKKNACKSFSLARFSSLYIPCVVAATATVVSASRRRRFYLYTDLPLSRSPKATRRVASRRYYHTFVQQTCRRDALESWGALWCIRQPPRALHTTAAAVAGL